MPVFVAGRGVGGRGTGFTLGPEQNTFGDTTTADRAAAEALRDTYTTANAAWLALYNTNRSNFIQLIWNGGDVLQRRNVAGTAWEDGTNVIIGRPGPAGMNGAPGGGALEHFATWAVDEITAAQDDLFIDMGFDWPTDVRFLAYTQRGRMFWMDLYLILGDPTDPTDTGIDPSTAGTASTGDTRVQALEGLSGNMYFGKTAAGGALVEIQNTQTDAINTPFYRYVPSAVQGGRSDAEIQALIDATNLSALQGQVTDGQIPAAIMRDAEFTAAAVRNLLGLTATEVNNLFVGRQITGGMVTITLNDGNTFTFNTGGTDGVLSGGTISADGMTLTLTRTEGGPVTVSIPEVLRQAGLNQAAVQNLIDNAGHATQTDLDALAARVAALEGGVTPTPHALTRYAFLGASGSTPGDFTEANFLSGAATSSMTQDITTPASDDDMVVALAVPTSEGPLTAVAELTQDGDVNQFADMIRGNFLPAVGDPEVTLEIDGDDHYVYCTTGVVRGIFLGVIGYRLTQTAP